VLQHARPVRVLQICPISGPGEPADNAADCAHLCGAAERLRRESRSGQRLIGTLIGAYGPLNRHSSRIHMRVHPSVPMSAIRLRRRRSTPSSVTTLKPLYAAVAAGFRRSSATAVRSA
jgi:hypothetical protein